MFENVFSKAGLMNKENNRGNKLLKNSLLFVIGELSSKIIIFVMVPFYTCYLTTEQYSISDLVTTTVSLATPFLTIIISEAVMRFALDKNENKSFVFSIGLYVCILGTILSAVLSRIAFLFVQILSPYWVLFVLYFFTFNLYTIETNYLKGCNRVKAIALIGIINTVILVGSNVFFIAFLKLGIEGYLISTIISNGISALIIFIGLRLYKDVVAFRRIDRNLIKRMTKYSIPMVPNSAMWWINNSSDRYIVTYLISSAANGIYTVAYKIPSIFSVFISIFMQAWQISVVDDFGTDEGNKFFNAIYDIFVKGNILICAFIVVSSKALGVVLYQNDFFPAWKYSVLLIIGYSFHSLAGFLGTVYTSAKETKRLFTSTAAAAIANIVLNVFLIRMLLFKGSFIATMGAAIATMVSYFISYIVRRIRIDKYLTITVKTKLFAFEYLLIFFIAGLMLLDNLIAFIAAFVLFLIICVINLDFIKMLMFKVNNIHKLKKL